MRVLQGRDGSISVRLEAERGDPVRGNRTYETVEMMDPMTGNPFAAIVEPGKYPEGTKITGEMYARVTRERDELLAALKALATQADACEKSIALEYGKPFEEPDFRPSVELKEARALIARIEGHG